jgi:hypothetical protein
MAKSAIMDFLNIDISPSCFHTVVVHAPVVVHALPQFSKSHYCAMHNKCATHNISILSWESRPSADQQPVSGRIRHR